LDIFVDTGVVFGYAWIDDEEFHAECLAFRRKHPVGKNKYYSTKNILKKEIDGLTDKRTASVRRVIRRIINRAEEFYGIIDDVAYPNHSKYPEIFGKIHAVLLKYNKKPEKKNHDAIYLANAHIWENETAGLVEPHFVTTDKTDIYENRDEIQNEVNACLSCTTALTIEYVRNLV
jgi:hypothetical protein